MFLFFVVVLFSLFISCSLNNIFAHVDINKKITPLVTITCIYSKSLLAWFFHEYIAKKVQKSAWMYL